MKSKEEYISILKNRKDYLMRKYSIANIALFGSVARNEHREDSDIDIFYESSTMSLFTLCRLKAELEAILGCSVDLFRNRKDIESTHIGKSIKKDLIYV